MKKPMLLTFVIGLLMSSMALAADWPTFRGNRGGIADDKDLPVSWDAANVLWKKQLPGPGSSSPITYANKVFVTCYSGYGTKLTGGMGKGKGGFGGGFGGPDEGGDQKNLKLHLFCFDRKSGGILWKKEIEPKLPEAPFSGFMREHGYATSTPTTDGERVYVFFGKTGVMAFTLDGEKIWTASVGTSTDGWGSASSPIVVNDLVIVNAAIESGTMVALDAKTGKEKWRVKGVSKCWTTPLLVATPDGKQEVVLALASKIAGYDPRTGDELWHCKGGSSGGGGGGGFGGKGKGGGGYTSSTPVARDGIVYVTGGGGPNPAYTIAVKTGGRGDVEQSHVLWRKGVGTGIASPVVIGDKLCWVSGSVTALSLKDGATVAQERLYNARSEYVSPVLAGDKIFALTRSEGLYVLDARDKLKELAHNEFKGDSSIFNASPAICDGQLFLRSNQYLYCIGKK